MNLDWSEAPEGAEAGHLGGQGLYPAWFRKDVAGLVEQICPAAGINTWTWMGGRKDFPVGSVLRPPIFFGHGVKISAVSEGFEIFTHHQGLASSIKNACAKGLDIEVFGYRFTVVEFKHGDGAPCTALLAQVNEPSVKECRGEGFPPTNTICEVQMDSGEWKSCEVVAQKGCRCIAFVDSITAVVISKSGRFRVAKTQEERAAEERLNKAIELYGAVMDHSGQSFKSLPEHRQKHYLNLVDEGWQKVPRA